MANRNYNQFKGSLDKGVVHMQGMINLSSAAAVLNVKGVRGASVAKTGTGQYTLTMEDNYMQFLSAQATLISLATNASSVVKIRQLLDQSNADVSSTGKQVRKIVFETTSGAGVPTDVVVACSLSFFVVLRNSSAV